MAISRELKKAGKMGGKVVVAGGIVYGLYEGYLFVRFKMYRKKNPSSNITTFAAYKTAHKAGTV